MIEPYHQLVIPGHLPEPHAPIGIGNDTNYEVEEILDSRRIGHSVKYLVSWKGYPISEVTWEPVDHLKHCPNLVYASHTSIPTNQHP